MIRRLLIKLAARLSQPRVIHDGDGGQPYLTRFYLLGMPRMADGSHPFDKFGDMKEGAKWHGRFGLYLHRFHRSDSDRELHNHPWRWSLSLVLAGGYIEERRQGDRVIKRPVLPGSFNWIGHEDYHRVDLIEQDAWTLFLVGPKVSSWGFWNRDENTFQPWRDFLNEKRGITTTEIGK